LSFNHCCTILRAKSPLVNPNANLYLSDCCLYADGFLLLDNPSGQYHTGSRVALRHKLDNFFRPTKKKTCPSEVAEAAAAFLLVVAAAVASVEVRIKNNHIGREKDKS
jgi:hypothetical protein